MLRSQYARWCHGLCWLSLSVLLTGCGTESPVVFSESGDASSTVRPDPAEDAYGGEENHYSLSPSPSPAPGPAPASVREESYRRMAPRIASREEIGTGMGGDRFAFLAESGWVSVHDQPLSTFSIDVDTASYSKARMYLMQQGTLPPIDAVRIEEFVNYFDYDYPAPTNGDPFATHLEVADCPWSPGHQLVRVALKGREVNHDRPPANLVFLIDISGSMASPQKIGLVKQSLRLLAGQLTAQDRVSMVVYASREGLVLPATEGNCQVEILSALERLEAGGSTNGGAGIQLAYSVAKQELIPGGVNRVILCTDGDFNVGVTSTGDLVRMAENEAKAGVFLTVLGFGMGNHNDAMLEELSNKANGSYAFIDNAAEARKVFVDQIDSTLVTIAKDVKIQVEFNPAQVQSYRLIGYENRLLQAHEFNDDRKDAGEVGAGHTVTALYELVPAGANDPLGTPRVDPLRYQQPQPAALPAGSEELLTLKVRYKDPEANRSQLMTVALTPNQQPFGRASTDFRFAASVAAFGMVLRQSDLVGDTSLETVLELAAAATGPDRRGYRGEFLQLVQAAQRASGRDRTSSRIEAAHRSIAATPSLVRPQVWIANNSPPQPVVAQPATICGLSADSLPLAICAWLLFNVLSGFLLAVICFAWYRVARRPARCQG